MSSTETLYTNLEQSQIVAPVMNRLRILPDGLHFRNRHKQGDDYVWGVWQFVTAWSIFAGDEERAYAYRFDKLLLALPEWVLGYADRNSSTCEMGDKWHDKMPQDNEELYWKIENVCFDLFCSRGPEAIQACCSLIHLLEMNDLLAVGKTSRSPGDDLDKENLLEKGEK